MIEQNIRIKQKCKNVLIGHCDAPSYAPLPAKVNKDLTSEQEKWCESLKSN